LALGVLYRGRALPFHFITYSSKTIGSEATSRNAEKMSYVIRLNHGNNPTIIDKVGDKVALSILPGEKKVLKEVYYQGKVKVNLAGVWKAGLREPLWLISNLEPDKALDIYQARMEIEESFKDLKSLLNLEKVMNKKRDNMEKMVAMVLLAYNIGLLVGEEIRDWMYGGGKKEGAVFGTVHPAKAAGATG
jgi:transposase